MLHIPRAAFRLAVTWSVFGIGATAWAAPLEDGYTAYRRYDFAETLRVIAPLAEAGNPKAQGLLGRMYVNGQGVSLSTIKAVRWLRRAAEKGDADAQDELGLLFFRGRGVPMDSSEAAKWFALAAEQGHADALQCLGGLYATGNGVPQSYARAHVLYRLAERNGSGTSHANLVALEAHMTVQQLDEARRLLSEHETGRESGRFSR